MEKSKVVGRGVRKGAWTKEEDNLLKKCVENYGEGKWHLVPPRAGLNRCRKSCRLRWLNYLRPNLKRGIFNNDEIDLIVRLHKLLGNRWSWIAGRVPGRTANDIKNFWNTHFDRKKRPSSSAAATTGESSRRAAAVKTITRSNIIRPQPWNISNNYPSHTKTSEKTNECNEQHKNNTISPSDHDSLILLREAADPINYDQNNNYPKEKVPLVFLSSQEEEEEDECIRWWGNLLEMTEKDHGATPPLLFSDDHPITETTLLLLRQGDHDNSCTYHGGFSSTGLCSDVDVWELLRSPTIIH